MRRRWFLAAGALPLVAIVSSAALASVITRRVSVDTTGGDPDGYSRLTSISADGRYAAFGSAASDLVGGDGNGFFDVFVRDFRTRTTVRTSVDTEGGTRTSRAWIPH